MSEDPVRLLDDAATNADLRRDLERTREHPSMPFDTTAELARFKASVGGGGAPPTSSGPLVAGGTALAIGAALVGVWLANREPTPTEFRSVPNSVVPNSVSVAAPEEPPPTETGTDLDSDTPSLPEEPRPLPRPRPAPEGSDVQRELALMARIRAELPRDPALALSLTTRGEREFPRGLLAEEREASAILALDRLGRAADARRRGAAFLRAHPMSAFAERIRAIVDAQ